MRTIGSTREIKRPTILGGFIEKAFLATEAGIAGVAGVAGLATTKALVATGVATNKAINATATATTKALVATGAISEVQLLEDKYVHNRESLTTKELNIISDYYMQKYFCFTETEQEIPLDDFYHKNVEKAVIYLRDSALIGNDKYSALKLINYYSNFYLAIKALPPQIIGDCYSETLTKSINLTAQLAQCTRELNRLIDKYRVDIEQIYVIEANLYFKGIPLGSDSGLEILRVASEHRDIYAKFEYGKINLLGLHGQSDINTALGLLTTCANQNENKVLQSKALALIAKYYGDLPEVICDDEYLYAIEIAQRASIEFHNDITYSIAYALIVLNLHNRHILTGDMFKGHHHTCLNHLNICILTNTDINTTLYNKALSLLGQLSETNPSIIDSTERAIIARKYYERATNGMYPDKYASKRLLIASLNGALLPLFDSTNTENINKYYKLCESIGINIQEDESLESHRRPTC